MSNTRITKMSQINAFDCLGILVVVVMSDIDVLVVTFKDTVDASELVMSLIMGVICSIVVCCVEVELGDALNICFVVTFMDMVDVIEL